MNNRFNKMDQLKVIELYSGIGGMHYAIKMANLNANIVAAVDINPNANLVYKHNFKTSKVLQKTIEGIKLEEYNKLDFDMIVMSPPCQPFTRQGNQNGANDARAQSFLNLIDLIPKLQKKPKYILMENVKGFDEDQARVDFIKMLKSQNYYYQEFLLSPIQFGIPNSRLRYFLIARYNEPFDFESTGNIINTLPSKVKPWINEMINSLNFSANINNLSSEETVVPNNLTAHIKRSQINEDYKNCSQSVSEQILVDEVKTLRDFVSNQMGHQKDLFLNDEMFLKSINLMDLVSVNSTRTSCFTKNYGRYLEGTGSILRVIDAENPKLEEAESIEIRQDSIRFFSPKEIANLHCFPNEFSFPKELTTLQKFKLIGNSLNVLIVAVLLRLLTS